MAFGGVPIRKDDGLLLIDEGWETREIESNKITC
jgi:hypothetical protein